MKCLLLHGNNKNCKKFYSTDPWKDLYEKILHLGILINTITTTINLKEIADQDERHLSCVCAKNTYNQNRQRWYLIYWGRSNSIFSICLENPMQNLSRL
jgi:hypothetical protein